MRSAASRLKGKFYLLGFGALCLSLSSIDTCVAQLSPLTLNPVTSNSGQSLAQSKYNVLRTRVFADDLTVDWVEFRTVATAAGLDSFDWHSTRQRVLKDLDAGNLPLALSAAQTVIAHNMANPEGHLLAMTAYQQMGMEQAADRESRILDGLVKSIMNSGDGMSAQHAWSTVSKSEEEFVVSVVLDADTESQTTVLADGRAYDRRTVHMEDGEHVLWFKSTPESHASVASIRPPKH
jgi:hypothetical protein